MPDAGWKEYWERLKDERKIFRTEAADYVSRLRRMVDISNGGRVLDFGCGFGYAAASLAAHVNEVYLWDQAENMRRSARANVSGLKNAVCLEASSAEDFPRGLAFDLILVNSVIQYMPGDDLSRWIGRWKSMLSPGGRIVISDIPGRNAGAFAEILSLMSFGAGRGFLFRAIWKGLREMNWYFRMRKSHPLRRYRTDDLEEIASKEGLAISVFSRNLSFRKHRLSVALSRPEK